MKSETFRAFITDEKPQGCGWGSDGVARVSRLIGLKIEAAEKGAPEELAKLRELDVWFRGVTNPGPGGDQVSEDARERQAHDGSITYNISNGHAPDDAPSPGSAKPRRTKHGTGRAYTSKRLEDQRPDLFERVKAGELSPHAAAIEAGWIKPKIQAPEDIDELAAYLKRKYTATKLQRLVELLTGEG